MRSVSIFGVIFNKIMIEKDELKWVVIQNITIIIAIAVVFYLTHSAWIFLLLLAGANYKVKEDKDDLD